MFTVNDIQDRIIESFSLFEDDMESKLFYLMALGKKLAPMPDALKTDDNLVKGCQSKVWLNAKYEQGKVWFEADSNTEITKGLISLLIEVWNGRPAAEILNT